MYKILLVEDNVQLENLYQTALTAAGYEVTWASTVDRAVTVLQEMTPDLILLDVILPGGKNGFDLLETIKGNPKYEKIPVIMLTSLDSEKNVALQIGASDYVVKSDITIQDLVAKVKEHIKK